MSQQTINYPDVSHEGGDTEAGWPRERVALFPFLEATVRTSDRVMAKTTTGCRSGKAHDAVGGHVDDSKPIYQLQINNRAVSNTLPEFVTCPSHFQGLIFSPIRTLIF